MDISEMKKFEPTFLNKAKKGGYVCPACGNGSGTDGTGLTHQNGGTSYHCFVCGLHGDVIDLYGVYAGITDAAEKIRGFREYFHIAPDKPIENSIHKSKICEQKKEDKKMLNFTKYYNEVTANNDGQYLAKRGISKETQEHFRVGYDPSWRSPAAVEKMAEEGKNPNYIPASPRVIIPRNSKSYLARDTRSQNEIPEKQQRYAKQNEGKVALFNLKNALMADTVFVVEGEIDAMSIYEAGGEALALCSTSNVKMFLEHIAAHKKDRQLFVLMMDNDEAGKKAQKELLDGLTQLDICCKTPDYDYKDPNDYLVHDPNGLKQMVMNLAVQFLPNNAQGMAYFRDIENQPLCFEAKTGFAMFDNEEQGLYGGLHEGLHIAGAIMSLGKTTFAVQLADQIAERGTTVLYFAAETPRYELQAKSISREMFKLYGKETSGGRLLAKASQQISNNRRYASYTPEEKEAINAAIDKYEKYAWRVHIIDKDYARQHSSKMTMKFITNVVDEYVRRSGLKPVVFIDYLQILAPNDPRMSEKQAVDASAEAMKDLAMKHHIPVFAISSFNRQSYQEAVDVTSFKESGGIEYFADYLYALQYRGMDEEEFPDKSRAQYVRRLITENKDLQKIGEASDIQFKCLKQRNGELFDFYLKFTAAYSFYEDLSNTSGFRDAGETPFDNNSKKNSNKIVV